MATYSAATINDPVRSSENATGAVLSFTSTATGTAVATADKIRVGKIAGGTKVAAAILVNTTFGTTVPATLQFEPLDGSSAVNFGSVDGLALQTANANGLLYAKAPVTVEKDSFVTLLLGTVATGNGTGVATVTLLGEGLGIK